LLLVLSLLGMVMGGARSAEAEGTELTGGNLLVSTADTVYEYTPDGRQVQAIAVPYPTGTRPGTETARDVVASGTGELHVYNGTFEPFLSTYASRAGSWTHHTHPGWSTVNNVSYGGIAVFERFLYATDMRTFGDDGADEASGIVRFDTDGFDSARFAERIEFIDLTVGLDGLLYALEYDEQTVRVYDPRTVAPLRTIRLAAGVRGIAVDEAGDIFGASWDDRIYNFGSAGELRASVASGTTNLTDIDLSPAGGLVAGSRFGDVVVTNKALANVRTFSVGGEPTFVAFLNATAPQQCSDARDNDRDGTTDYPRDPGCSSLNDNDESNPPPPPPNQCTITRGSGNDVIRGTFGDDVICAGAGNDVVYGGGGNDAILGQGGNDALRGQAGNDRLSGGPGNDSLTGSSGNDSLVGGPGNDSANGGPGNDSCPADPRDARSSCSA
jgi:Ca2+-binding RTX toxin-like protein